MINAKFLSSFPSLVHSEDPDLGDKARKPDPWDKKGNCDAKEARWGGGREGRD